MLSTTDSTEDTPPPGLPGGGGGLLPRGSWPFFLLGLVLLAVGVSFWRPAPAGVWHDDGVYLVIGKALSDGSGLRYAGVPGALPAVKFPPAYPATLAVLWKVFGSLRGVTLAAVGLNLLLLAVSGSLVALALHRSGVLSRWGSVALGALAFISADVWRPALVPLSEALFIALLAGALAAWGWASREGDRRGSAVLALVLVAAVLTRSAAAAVVVGFALALVRARGVRVAGVVIAPAVLVGLGWSAWASSRARLIPEGLQDVLGPYGGWLVGQLVEAPGAFLRALPTHGLAVFERVLALLLPGVAGPWLWVAAAPVALLALVGAGHLSRRLPPVPWILAAYLGMLLLWPFVDRRLVAPMHPIAVVSVGVGAYALWRRAGRKGMRNTVAGLGFAWVVLLTSVTASRAARGWAVAGYQLRAGRLAAAVEALERTSGPGAVVGAPEFWAGLHLHGGWQTVPSARFTPRADDEALPVWGSPADQLAIWWGAGVDHVLLEQGGQIHGEALNLLEDACPGAVNILARMPPQLLVSLTWDAACARSLGLGAS